MLIIANATLGGFLFSYDRIPELVGNFIVSFTQNPIIILGIIMIFILFLGTIIEGAAILIITVPMFIGLTQSVGISPITLGIVMVL
ncbi:MAG: TRAP transporter large permease subunit, partial [Candidatus Asgardarchaeia archaeon]